MSTLSISDWIAFLTSEKDAAINTILNFGALSFAFAGIILVTLNDGNLRWVGSAILIIYVIYVFYKVFRPWGRTGGKAERILKKIMKGDLNNSEDIQKAWLSEESPALK